MNIYAMIITFGLFLLLAMFMVLLVYQPLIAVAAVFAVMLCVVVWQTYCLVLAILEDLL